MLKSLVILSNGRSRDIGNLLAIARAEAQKREHTHQNLTIRTIRFISECGVYVALYEPPVENSKRLDVKRGKVC